MKKSTYLKSVHELQRRAGLREMDTHGDAERQTYEAELLDRIVQDIKELQDSLASDGGPAPISYIYRLINKHMEQGATQAPDTELPF